MKMPIEMLIAGVELTDNTLISLGDGKRPRYLYEIVESCKIADKIKELETK